MVGVEGSRGPFGTRGLVAWGIVAGLQRWSAGSTGQIQSIAVLPLQNLSGDPAQGYFADGMTDQLVADLATIDKLRVISRTR